MRRSISLALVCAGLGAISLGARADAADYPYPQSQPAGAVVEYGSGWYLRGDIGYRTDVRIGEVYSNVALPAGLRLDNIATAGGGGGYKAGWFRSDITIDYSGRARFSSVSTPNGAYDAKVDTLVALVNVYADLGTWSGLTPYIGIGAGVANFWVDAYAPPNGPINPDKQSKADFAWAYIAGLAWSFAPRWSADFSYRYLNLGETTFNPHLPNTLTLKDLTANEFRIGLRYNLD